MKAVHFIKIGPIVAIIILPVLIAGCRVDRDDRKQVVYINSYHRGHPSSDEIMDAVVSGFPAERYDLRSYFMDTKRNPEAEYIEAVAGRLLDSIKQVGPDIVIVSDDNAVKYIVQPLVAMSDVPVVFCGVNGSADDYRLPREQVTGMIEVLPVAEAVATVKNRTEDAETLLVLNENTTTSRKEAALLDTLYRRLGVLPDHRLVDDFAGWKAAFTRGNERYDMIYIVTHGAIAGWDHEEAVQHVRGNILVPVFTCEDFMMPYAVVGVTKVASEQGLWAVDAAKRILHGATPASIPITRNTQAVTWINEPLAAVIGFEPDSALLEGAVLLEQTVSGERRQEVVPPDHP